MPFWIAIFYLSTFLIFYNYIGYACIVALFNFRKRKNNYGDAKAHYFQPTVTFIVAAYNEQDCIENKIYNTLQLDYPADKIEFIFITDGSTDNTPHIISQFPHIKLMHTNERKGKSAAMNRAVQAAINDIIVFSDANTNLNTQAIQNIVRHYFMKDVGGVAGEKKVVNATSPSGITAEGEGFYWKYESFLKKLDSNFHSVVGAAGELFSIRKDLYEEIAENVILDDFVLSLKVAQKGYRIIYEPQAYALELPSYSILDEQKRKIRIAAGGFQAIGMLSTLLHFWKHPRLSFLYFSHRLLRWAVTPLCLFISFFSNLIISIYYNSHIFNTLLIFQVLFYMLAILGNIHFIKESKITALKVPYYFVFMNISVIQGLFRFIKGKQPATWEKVRRQPA